MARFFSKLILNNRITILLLIVAITVFYAFQAFNVVLEYELATLLPPENKDRVDFEKFKANFESDKLTIVAAIEDKDFYTPEKFNKWHLYGLELSKINGVDSVFSETNVVKLVKNDSLKTFEIVNLYGGNISTQKEMDSIQLEISKLPFYNKTIKNPNSDIHLMVVLVDKTRFNSNDRKQIINEIKKVSALFEQNFSSTIKLSGLPFVRAANMIKTQQELTFFVIMAIIVTTILLLIIFRSVRVIALSGIIVVLGVIWSLGVIGLTGFKLSGLMGLIPPLIIIIGVPNCVYVINKYQFHFKKSGGKKEALFSVIESIGPVMFLTNLTTAFGLSTFVFANVSFLIEFGIVAFICVLQLFFVTICIIPISYSYFAKPKTRHTKHLDRKILMNFISSLIFLVRTRRSIIYLSTFSLVLISFIGIYNIEISGKIIDDLPDGMQVKEDIVFLEEKVSGVMPFDILIDFKEKAKAQKTSSLLLVEAVQEKVEEHPFLSKTLSIVDGLKFINQSFYNGREDKYSLPSNRDRILLKRYFDNAPKTGEMLKGLTDSTQSIIRITGQIHDVGTKEMYALSEVVSSQIDSILNPSRLEISSFTERAKSIPENEIRDSIVNEFYKFPEYKSAFINVIKSKNASLAETLYSDENEGLRQLESSEIQSALIEAEKNCMIDFVLTGTSMVFTKGSKYLVENLFISLVIAVLLIAFLMVLLFRSFWMVLVSIISNIIPLIVTAGIMGFVGVPIKPSTILVFSIALGISVDDAIHYLAKFKQELNNTNGNVKHSVYYSLSETGISMMYTSIILFFGFGVFVLSDYGGTKALGLLTSITLIVAMLTNLVLLPSLLLTLQNKLEKQFKKEEVNKIKKEEVFA